MPPPPQESPNHKFEIQQRRHAVAERYLLGQTQWQIARSLEVDQKTVSRDLEAIRSEWRSAALRNYDAKVDEELARLDRAEREYWSAWERSKQERQSSRTRKRTGRAAGDEAEVRKEQRDGNPRFLEGVVRCVALRCRILGIIRHAPEEHHSHQQVNILTKLNVDVSKASADDIESFLAARAKLLGPAVDGSGGGVGASPNPG